MSDNPLHLVLLEFADTSRAGDHVDGHNEWIDSGFGDGVFLLTGSMPGRGGTVLMNGLDRAGVDERLRADPFVEHGVVVPEIIVIVPSRLDARISGVLA